MLNSFIGVRTLAQHVSAVTPKGRLSCAPNPGSSLTANLWFTVTIFFGSPACHRYSKGSLILARHTSNNRPATSVARQLMLAIGGLISIAVVVVAALAYAFVTRMMDEQAPRQMQNSVHLRAQQQGAHFPLAEASVDTLATELRIRLDRLAPGEADRRFAQLFSRSQDKVWRLNRNVSDTHRHPTFYLQDGQGITSSIRRRAIASFDLLSERGPALVPPYFSAYVDFVERGLMVYSPGIDWGAAATPQTDNLTYPTMIGSDPRNNPGRHRFWTPVYYDGEAKAWMVSVIHPLDWQGQWIGTVGHDVVIDTLLKNIDTRLEPGMINLILSRDGNLIAHPDLVQRISQAQGQLSLTKLRDPLMDAVFAMVRKTDTQPQAQLTADGKYWVAWDRIPGPDWWSITLYPRALTVQQGQRVAIVVVVSGFLGLLVTLLIVSGVIKGLIRNPLRHIEKAVDELAEHRQPQPIALNSHNELGRLATAFDDMVVQISQQKQTVQAQANALRQEVAERIAAENRLRLSASVFANSHESIIITDAQNRIVDVNPAFTRITGYPRDEMLGRDPQFLDARKHEPHVFINELETTLRNHGYWQGEVLTRRRDGAVFSEMVSISVVTDSEGAATHRVFASFDITQLKAHQAELDRIANYDPLTGVANRRLLSDRMSQALALAKRNNKPLAICVLDLDGFKSVNDQFGHATGDQLLIVIVTRLQTILRAGDTLARLGGDEFAMLFNEIHPDAVRTLLDRVLSAVNEPVELSRRKVAVSASIGVTLYPEDTADADTLLRHADQAMYFAKQTGKNRYHFFDPAQDQRIHAHREQLQRLREALYKDEFVLFYQPKVELKTGRLVGAEALIRWQHPENGLLPPAQFLPFIEHTDLEVGVGRWVITSALQQTAQWRRDGLQLEISVNISANHLQHPGFVNDLQHRLSQQPSLPAGSLQIEVLESAALEDFVGVAQVIEDCQNIGVSFALDDFGTGYSSLTYLRKLPATTLKIDQSFVRDMLDDRGDRAIVEGVIALCKTFNRHTVAEGVETAEHYQMLVELGCQYGQGYGIARPMPADQLLNWSHQQPLLLAT